jgi:hypothetical protein
MTTAPMSCLVRDLCALVLGQAPTLAAVRNKLELSLALGYCDVVVDQRQADFPPEGKIPASGTCEYCRKTDSGFSFLAPYLIVTSLFRYPRG